MEAGHREVETSIALIGIRAIRPWRADFVRWENCRNRLADLVEGTVSSRGWDGLRPEIRLAVCTEFLRQHEDPRYPGLRYLLLPAANRDPGRQDVYPNPYGVDIVGIGRDGGDLFAQVPTRNDNMKHNMEMGRKVKKLASWRGSGRTLVVFGDPWAAYLGYEAEGEPQPWVKNSTVHIRVDEVLK